MFMACADALQAIAVIQKPSLLQAMPVDPQAEQRAVNMARLQQGFLRLQQAQAGRPSGSGPVQQGAHDKASHAAFAAQPAFYSPALVYSAQQAAGAWDLQGDAMHPPLQQASLFGA